MGHAVPRLTFITKSLWNEPTLKLKTKSGIKNYRLIENIGENGYWFEAEIGKPLFASGDIPVRLADPKADAIGLSISVACEISSFPSSMSAILLRVSLSIISS